MLLRWALRHFNHELNHLSYNWQTLSNISVPEAFQIELTNHCPMACVMCPRTGRMTRATGYMDEKVFHRVIQEVAPYSSDIFLHHFGDSLTHPQIGEYIRLARQHGLRTYLSANPILLSDKRIRDLVDCGLHELVLSLDGVSAEISAAIRGKAAHNIGEAEQRVHALLKYRKERNLKKPFVIMQFVRQQLNRHEAKAWLEKWTSVEGIDAVKMKSFCTWDGRDERINVLRVEPAPDIDGIVCDKPWTSVTVLWDGRVVPCCFDYDGLYVLGNLRDQSLREICNGDPMRRLRQAHRERNVETVKLCARCTDKEGYPVGKWYYPLNRLLSQWTPLGNEDDVGSGKNNIIPKKGVGSLPASRQATL